MKMISESKLKEIRLSLYDDDGYTRINNPHFDLIFEEAFKAGMKHVNNGVLDDVIVSHLKALTKKIEDSHCYGFEDVLNEYLDSL